MKNNMAKRIRKTVEAVDEFYIQHPEFDEQVLVGRQRGTGRDKYWEIVNIEDPEEHQVVGIVYPTGVTTIV